MAETMLLPETIMEKGTLVADDFVQDPDLSMKKNAFFGAYFGIPSIYAVVAHHGPNQTSAYVSSATYACSLNPSSPMTCDVVTSNMSKVS